MYGLIGYPLGHSFSAKYFAEKFKKENIDEVYKLFPIPELNLLESLLEEYPELKGFNVTIPYKKSIFGYLDKISEDAATIRAVNVVKIKHSQNDNRLILTGYNTDWRGFTDSLLPLLNHEIKNALVLGNGGAAAAVIYALKKMGISVTVVSRTPKSGMIGYNQIDDKIIEKNLLIVNTTPLGMYPNTNTCPPIPYNLLTSRHICYDLVYNPEVTEFMRRAKQYGAIAMNGLEMLHLQAEFSWKIWNEP